MSHVRLAELNSSDMLDVIHYMFEDDTGYASAEQAEAKSTIRELLWRDVYNSTYKYATPKSRGTNTGSERLADFDIPDTVQHDIKQRPAKDKQATKPYIRPTELSEEALSQVLQPPLN